MISSRSMTWTQSAFAALSLSPVLLFVLYSVFIRIQSKYFSALLSVSGLDGDRNIVHQVFLYRYDLLLLGVLAPLAMMLSLRFLRYRTTLLAWGTLILLAQVLMYANLQSWGQVGRFLNWPAVVNAVSFGISNPEFVGDYLALRGVLKTGALLLASAFVMVAAVRLKPGGMLLRLGSLVSVLVMAAALVAALFGLSSSMKRAPIAGSFFANAVQSLIVGDNREVEPVPATELEARFEELSGAPLDDFRGRNFGVESGMNLLVFVMETGSIEFLDVRRALPVHPVLERLRSKLFLVGNHFSTFPASAESNLSLLTGLYPPRALYDTCLVGAITSNNGGTVPGVIPALHAEGYQTALYAPFKSQVPADKLVYEMTGFERVYYGQDHNPQAVGGSDSRTLLQLTEDLAAWAQKDQRFAVAYFPQVGHGPWSVDLGATIRERGHRMALLQLDWLAQLTAVLEQSGQLERTVIVLTSDHGVRTSQEDPRVRVGMIDQYSLHVPLLIYAPHADYSGVDTSAPSSHVDLAAELAQLFGVPRTPVMQGLALDHPKRATRRQFLMANWYYGADGYRDQQESAMYSIMLDAAYLRPDQRIDFTSAHLVRDRAVATRISNTLAQMLDLQESWILERACSALGQGR